MNQECIWLVSVGACVVKIGTGRKRQGTIDHRTIPGSSQDPIKNEASTPMSWTPSRACAAGVGKDMERTGPSALVVDAIWASKAASPSSAGPSSPPAGPSPSPTGPPPSSDSNLCLLCRLCLLHSPLLAGP
eukprot:CAMPEP_0184288004 /NCGR_PEP_ID=MMETSP1049-20130417/445_1 /TAXON_ID=77928 /ORGANISM="Proteomonas sulcata, Strain CCMP704" /LENGTH=130 /DNA_ID=CAMNT_0026594153 /DNA_START=50 /DNA_END=440 /DNA_ORIENTATION=+